MTRCTIPTQTETNKKEVTTYSYSQEKFYRKIFEGEDKKLTTFF